MLDRETVEQLISVRCEPKHVALVAYVTTISYHAILHEKDKEAKDIPFYASLFLGLIENGTIDVPLEVVDILLEGRREKLTYHCPNTRAIVIKAIMTRLANPKGAGISFFATALSVALNWGLVKADDSFKTLCRKPPGPAAQKLLDKILKGATEAFMLSGRWPYFSDPSVN